MPEGQENTATMCHDRWYIPHMQVHHILEDRKKHNNNIF